MKKTTSHINTTIYRFAFTLAAILFLSIFAALNYGTQATQAAPVTGFKAGRIIDDAIFTNSKSMTVSQIQAFLESKVPTCDTWGTQPSEFGGGTRAQWGAARGTPAPFICLRNYTEGGRSAAQIIHDTAQYYVINPQVLLVLLQKEQGLVTDTWPLPSQYRTATGYGCPDTAPCDTQYFGFTNQVMKAARMFRVIINADPGWYTPYVLGNNFIRYSPDSNCGGSNVIIENRSTQALYNYTPYQPNQAALNAGWGAAPCGAYGNRNFYQYFVNWFGSTYVAAYDYQFVGSSAAYINLDYGQTTDNSITIKNTGGVSWYADGAVPVGNTMTRLSVQSYGSTPFADRWGDPNWLGSLTQIKMTPSVVAPGETATFNFKFKAPNYPYAQTITFVPVVDGITFMKNVNMQFVVRSSPPVYKYVSSSFAPAQLNPGEKFTANVVLKNNGFGPWYADGAAPGKPSMRLSTLGYAHNPFADTSDSNWLGTTSQVKMTPAVVYPGQNATFTFGLIGPDRQLNHTFRFLPVLDGVTFLQDYGMAFNLSGPGRVYTYEFHAVSAPPATMSPGQVVTTTLQLKNTGNTTWKNESTRTARDTALRLVMMNPWYRLSTFRDPADPAWLSAGQIAMQTPEVAPGQIGTFTFNWKAPTKKGLYIESFSPVADGVTGLQDKGMGYIVNVQ